MPKKPKISKKIKHLIYKTFKNARLNYTPKAPELLEAQNYISMKRQQLEITKNEVSRFETRLADMEQKLKAIYEGAE